MSNEELAAQVAKIEPGDWVRARFNNDYSEYWTEGPVYRFSGTDLRVGNSTLRRPNGTTARWLVEIIEHRPAPKPLPTTPGSVVRDRVGNESPTREHLIDLCQKGVVPHEKWCDRDTSSAQRQLGEALALLLAQCDFWVEPEIKHNAHWVHVRFDGFNRFEYGDEVAQDEKVFYIPTAEGLARAAGWDWC